MVVQVMVLWVTAFWLLGCFVVPIALDLAGLEREDLSSRGQASALKALKPKYVDPKTVKTRRK